MSWSTRIGKRLVRSGICRITSPSSAVSSSGSPGPARRAAPAAACRRPPRRPRPTDVRPSPSDLTEVADPPPEPHELDAWSITSLRRSAARPPECSCHDQHVLVDRQAGDRLLGLECSAQAPPHATGSRSSPAGRRRRRRPSPRRADEAAEDIEELGLAGPVGTDQAVGADAERQVHVVDRCDTPNLTVRFEISITLHRRRSPGDCV